MSIRLSFQKDTTSPPAPNKPRSAPRKLRETCDACALSKIRCGREQPNCSRCVSQRLCCNYSISRRMGKRRASSIGMIPTFGVEYGEQAVSSGGSSSSFISPTLTTISLSTEVTGSSGSSVGQQQTLSEALQYAESFDFGFPAVGTAAALHNEDLMMLHRFDLNGLMSDEFTPRDTSIPSPFDPALLEPWLWASPNSRHTDSFFSDNIDSLRPSLTPSTTAPSMINSIYAPIGNVHAIPSKFDCPIAKTTASFGDIDSKDCVHTILSVLQLQYVSPYSCRISAEDKPNYPTVDQVLNDNKSAIASISAVFECSCASDPVTLILLTLLISKMLAWYSAIL